MNNSDIIKKLEELLDIFPIGTTKYLISKDRINKYDTCSICRGSKRLTFDHTDKTLICPKCNGTGQIYISNVRIWKPHQVVVKRHSIHIVDTTKNKETDYRIESFYEDVNKVGNPYYFNPPKRFIFDSLKEAEKRASAYNSRIKNK